MLGKQIQQYKIVEKIGVGGMGEVYLAEDIRLGRKAALKFLPERFNADPEFKSRFEHEARAAAALNHPNIVTVYDLGEYEGRLFIAMEHISGHTLAELIDAGEMTMREAVDFGIQICDGLDAAHSAGIIHRDIKPANILIDDRGRARLLDFGIAKSRLSTTDTGEGTTHGTVQYGSPEQTRGERVDHRSDLFSLGSVLYEMITGRLPFPGEYDEAIRYAIQQEAVEPLARYKKDVPPELEQVVDKLLEKDPAVRYQSAVGVISDLKRIQRNLTQATPPSRKPSSAAATPKTPAPNRSRKRVLIPTAIIVVLLALVAVFKPWQLHVTASNEPHAAEDRLAIMYFDNLADPEDSERNAEIVTNLLITDLTGSPDLQIVSSQRLYDILRLLNGEDTKRINRHVASQVAERAKARWMLIGSIVRTEPTPILTAELIEVATGNVITSTRIDGTETSDLFTLVDSLAANLRAQFAIVPTDTDTALTIADMTTASPEAYRFYLEGIDLLQKYKEKGARAAFEKAIAIDSNFAMAYYYLTDLYGWNKKGDLAIRKAVEFSDGLNERDRLFIRARHSLQMERWIDSIDLKRTEALYNEIIEKYPDEKEAYLKLGIIYKQVNRQNLPRAVEMLNRAIELDSLEKRAYNQLAFLYHGLGDFERSVWAINKYVEVAPDDANAYDSRGDLYALNGKLPEAIANYEQALKVDSNFTSSLQKVGYVKLFAGDIEGAVEAMQERISRQDPEVRSGGRAGLKNVSLYRGRLEEARKQMHFYLTSKEIELNHGEHTPELDDELADFFILLWKFTADNRWIDSALALKPRILAATQGDSSNRYFYRTAEFAAIRGDTVATDSILERWQSRRDTTIGWMEWFYQRDRAAIAYYRGEYDTAAYYCDLVDKNQMRFGRMVETGRAYLLAGQISKAVDRLEGAASNYGSSRVSSPEYWVAVYYWLGRAYEESGWDDKAIAQYQKVCDIWKDADPGIKPHEDAKVRLAKLTT